MEDFQLSLHREWLLFKEEAYKQVGTLLSKHVNKKNNYLKQWLIHVEGAAVVHF